LRTVFVERGGHPRAVVRDDLGPNIRFYDLSEVDAQEARGLLDRRVGEDQLDPFSLQEGPLFRVMVFRLSDGYDYLYMNMHHIITDGWSSGLLFNDFAIAYAALLDDRPVPLEALPFQYTDYAAWERQMEARGLWKEREEYMLKELGKPLPSLRLPFDFPRFDVQRYKGDELFFRTGPGEFRKIQEAARSRNVSTFMLTLTAYFILLKHLTQQDDIIVGFPAAGRHVREVENMVGFFVNTLAVRIRFDRCNSVEQLLEQVSEKCLHSYENQAYPFDLLVKRLNPERELDRSAIFTTTFALQNFPPLREPEGLRLFEHYTIDDLVERTSKFDLSLTAIESGDCLRFSFTYNSELFRKETIRTFGQQYLKVLDYMVEAL
jgi:Condensation domain